MKNLSGLSHAPVALTAYSLAITSCVIWLDLFALPRLLMELALCVSWASLKLLDPLHLGIRSIIMNTILSLTIPNFQLLPSYYPPSLIHKVVRILWDRPIPASQWCILYL